MKNVLSFLEIEIERYQNNFEALIGFMLVLGYTTHPI